MYFLATLGWKSGDSRKRRKNSYTSCGFTGRVSSGSGSAHLDLQELESYLQVRPGCLQRGLVFLRVELGAGRVGGRRKSPEHVYGKLQGTNSRYHSDGSGSYMLH